MITAQQIINAYPGDGYLAYHARRYAHLLELLGAHLAPDSKILDIGKSKLTELIANEFSCAVDTLGFGPDHHDEKGTHYHFDLNDAQDQTQWRGDLPRYTIIVMADVIEHLYTAPGLVLSFIKTLLAPRGLLVLQTPNAAALHKRLKLLLGANPYEQIRPSKTNPGHFREYTKKELFVLAKEQGLQINQCIQNNLYDCRYTGYAHGDPAKKSGLAWINPLYSILPKSYRSSITLLLQAP